MVKRYNLYNPLLKSGVHMSNHESGEYVKYYDYAALEAKLQAATEELEQCKKGTDWVHRALQAEDNLQIAKENIKRKGRLISLLNQERQAAQERENKLRTACQAAFNWSQFDSRYDEGSFEHFTESVVPMLYEALNHHEEGQKRKKVTITTRKGSYLYDEEGQHDSGVG